VSARAPLTADALALVLRAGERVVVGDPRSIDALLVDDARPMSLDVENGLLDVPGGVSLREAARFASTNGHAFPIGDPVPDLALSDACFAMPAFVDAFVAHADLVTHDGLRLSTPRAPRSATGPDLLGLALVDPPLAVVVRARVRVCPLEVARPREELHATPLDVAARVRALMHEGRAFVVEAARLRLRVLGPGAPHARTVDDAGVFPEATGARAIVASEDALVDGLVGGARVIASPIMGRVAIFDDQARAATLTKREADVRAWRVSTSTVGSR